MQRAAYPWRHRIAALRGIIFVLCSLGTVSALDQQSAQPGGAPAPRSGPFQPAGLVRVVDGSTLEASIDGKRAGIGIVGIDAPAYGTPCGDAARAQLQSLVGRGAVFRDVPGIVLDSRKRRMYQVSTPGEDRLRLGRQGAIRVGECRRTGARDRPVLGWAAVTAEFTRRRGQLRRRDRGQRAQLPDRLRLPAGRPAHGHREGRPRAPRHQRHHQPDAGPRHPEQRQQLLGSRPARHRRRPQLRPPTASSTCSTSTSTTARSAKAPRAARSPGSRSMPTTPPTGARGR